MVTRQIAGQLLVLARRRWPVDLRDELHREWEAELHVLASEGRRARMLLFAASLAARRSGVPPTDRAPLGRRLLRTALPLLLAPTACAAIVLAALTVANRLLDTLAWTGVWALDLQLPIASTMIAASAVGPAILADRLARSGGPAGGWRAVAAVTAPLAATGLLIAYAFSYTPEQTLDTAVALMFWLAALAVVLRAVAALAQRGRTRAAWVAGVLGALAVADLAVVLAVLGNVPTGPESVIDGLPQGDTIDPISAPLWLFAVYTNSSLGLPRPTEGEIFLITDDVLIEPLFFLATTPYALAWVIRAARRRREPDLTAAAPTVLVP
ncbi:hypothetical protein ACTMSW_05775 [Micromonospora sp. BQ11]|uniref:hypothetical protein n=1 Tax=Micromonospora sp. BQ11 TaxID=3452212 RepID=UPI003F8B4715